MTRAESSCPSPQWVPTCVPQELALLMTVMQRRCPAFWLVSSTVILNTAKIRQPLNANVVKEVMYCPFQVMIELTRTSLSPHYTRFCCANTTGWSVLWLNSTLTGKGRDSTRRHAKSWEDTSRFEMGSVPCFHNDWCYVFTQFS